MERLTHTLLSKARGLADRDWVLDEAGEGIVPLDEQRITQAVLQLADNAVKHTDDGDRSRRSGRRPTAGRSGSGCATPGPGCPSRTATTSSSGSARSVFSPGDEGFGLGLSIVRAIAEAHHGRVELDPATLPRRALRDHPAHRPGGTMARILIVEDENRIASFLAKGLRRRGPRRPSSPTTASTGLDHALSGDFDLMVLDIGLPRLDGFDVLDQLRSQGSRMPVIVLTARDSVTDTVSALEGGADDYMPKPFRFAELLARVRLRLRQAQDGDGSGVRDALEAGGVRLDLRTRRADGRRPGDRPVGPGVHAGRDLHAATPARCSRASSCSTTSGASTSTRAPTSSTSTSATCARSSAPTAITTVRGMGYRFNP